MHSLLFVLLLSMPVGGAFGEAAADGTVAGEGVISVEIEVEVPGARSVVAHVIDPGDDQITLAMNPRTGDVFAVSAELEQADLVIVFEILDGVDVIVSRPLTLSQLGVDPAVLGAIVEPRLLEEEPEAPEEEGILTAAIRQNIWLAVALGASALSLLAFWAAGPKEGPSTDSSQNAEAPLGADPHSGDLPSADTPSV